MLSWDDYNDDEPLTTASEEPVNVTAEIVRSVAEQSNKKVSVDEPVPASVQKSPSEPSFSETTVTNPIDMAALGLLELDIEEGLADLEMAGQRVTAEDKRMINGNSDVNQLVPLRYDWAWQKYLDGSQNHWMPQEINMQEDIQLWRSNKLTDTERKIIKRSLGYFSTADSVVANNLLLAIYKHITAPEARQYILLQAREEAIHIHAYQYCIESLSMDEREIFNMYREIPSVAKKAAWGIKHTGKILDDGFNTRSEKNTREFIKNLVAYYAVSEGIFFYCGFSAILSMGRRNMMKGVSEQFQYILRDESMHLNFGMDVINTIIRENPHVWDDLLKSEVTRLVIQGVILETEFAQEAMDLGTLGMNSTQMETYLQFIGNRRLVQMGLPQAWPHVENPFPWMSEMMDLKKEKNFFETKVIEYQQSSGLSWDG